MNVNIIKIKLGLIKNTTIAFHALKDYLPNDHIQLDKRKPRITSKEIIKKNTIAKHGTYSYKNISEN